MTSDNVAQELQILARRRWPLGRHPGGLAGAMCLEVSARIAERGGREVFINAGPRVDYPASGNAYAKAGFEARRRGRIWALRR